MGKPSKPTEAELAILGVLWQRGPSTVRQVHDALNAVKKTGYTTVLKFMQIMTEKGLVAGAGTKLPTRMSTRHGCRRNKPSGRW